MQLIIAKINTTLAQINVPTFLLGKTVYDRFAFTDKLVINNLGQSSTTKYNETMFVCHPMLYIVNVFFS